MSQTCRGINAGVVAFLLLVANVAHAADNESDAPWLQAYSGPTRTDIDATTLDGKVLCGYQGWFNTPGDGSGFGFTHWGQSLDRPDRADLLWTCGPTSQNTTQRI